MNTVFILHGWSYTTDPWGPVVSGLQQQGVPVELLNVPGLTDGTSRVWTLDDYVEWLKERVDTVGKVTLVGHSNGGRICLAFTAKYPDKVERLILIDSAGIYPTGVYITLKRGVFKLAATVGKKITSSEKLKSLLYRAAREKDYHNATPEMKKTMANLLKIDLRGVLKKIIVPTLIIWGAQDTSTPLSDGKLMHQEIARSRLVVLPTAKHSPHMTHPEKVIQEIVQELKTT